MGFEPTFEVISTTSYVYTVYKTATVLANVVGLAGLEPATFSL